jgi:hypothetical protein
MLELEMDRIEYEITSRKVRQICVISSRKALNYWVLPGSRLSVIETARKRYFIPHIDSS